MLEVTGTGFFPQGIESMMSGKELDPDAGAAGNDQDGEKEKKGGDCSIQVIVENLMMERGEFF